MAVGNNLDLDKGLPLRMSSVQDLFWCDARDEQGGLVHAPDCDQHEWFVVQGKKQDTHTGGKARLPDHCRCTIACAFCGKRKLYEDECYHKQRLSVKLKSDAQSGGGSAGGKSQGEKGKGKSQGRGKGQGQAQGKGGGRGGPDRKNQDKNKDKIGLRVTSFSPPPFFLISFSFFTVLLIFSTCNLHPPVPLVP